MDVSEAVGSLTVDGNVYTSMINEFNGEFTVVVTKRSREFEEIGATELVNQTFSTREDAVKFHNEQWWNLLQRLK